MLRRHRRPFELASPIGEPLLDAEASRIEKPRPNRRIRRRPGTDCRAICRFFDADQAEGSASRTAARRQRSQRSSRNALNPEIQKNGAGRVTRTPDLRITNALLYQLSYAGTEGAPVYAKHGCSTTRSTLISHSFFRHFARRVQPVSTGGRHRASAMMKTTKRRHRRRGTCAEMGDRDKGGSV